MPKFYNNIVIGIDVSADFSMVAILAPNGDVYRKSFKIRHNMDGFEFLLKEIKKAEQEFNMKTSLFMESTGVYLLPLLHFLQSKQLEAYVINPLITNSNKNQDIRKVKNDKKDALSIAKIGKFQDIKAYSFFDIPTFTLKCLCRDYYKLVDTKAVFKKKLSTDLYIVFPGYKMVFSDITGPSSIAILKQYQTPKAILEASKDDIINLLISSSKKGLVWCNRVYDKLIKAATRTIGISSPGLSIKLLNSISIIENFNEQISLLLVEIKNLIKSDDIYKLN